ncbi:tRNA(Ile)-lysidine synthase [Treponema bryantii]|uniref:tRNA(Ile)-lysidine synthase n=1 Tax=Treponema bryantii TaxID=163 RepID=A0A1I3JKU0_9SPIR|nr:tRNA lysidine(34) synthetase TilS [Treponema bryantii]SFI60873.1 tRNA(Ile)-lysidine synthase [Treponema bryantii]
MCEFEEKVKKNLIECGIKPDETLNGTQKIGLAVSGGADSVSLLLSLSSIFSSLYVITVNHNIRPAEESAGDAQYVSELCKKLQEEKKVQIFCKVVELKKGLVQSEAQKRGGGTEDAARALRYKAFEEFIADNSLDALCLAHNKNDQLETVLMRFLQGASLDSAGGIKERRGNYIRPLLNITRSEIEDYLTSQNISWRTDKTNFETDYLRNKIRLKLVPFLDENFEGWQKAVLSGAQKASEDSQVIQSLLSTIPLTVNTDDSVQLSLDDFLAAPDSIKYRILLEACNKAGEDSRIPHQFLKDVVLALDDEGKASFTKHFASIDIICEKKHLFIKKHTEDNTDLVFSDIIEKSGTFEFPFGVLNVFNNREQNGKNLVSVCAGEGAVVDGVSLPFCVRNISPGDTVICADGSEKKVSDILSDWHVAASQKSLVPVIQLLDEKSQRIKAVLGGFLGYKDWIVKL